MWGHFVESAGVGPKACPVNKLTADTLAKAFEDLASPKLQSMAKNLSMQMALEDGIQGGFVHFVDCLPRENMLCDISLLLGETVMARYELMGYGLRSNGIKVSSEVAALLELDSRFELNNLFKWCPTRKTLTDRQIFGLGIRRHSITNYNLSGHVESLHHGCWSAFWGLIFGSFRVAMQIYWKPDRWARTQGAFGCLFGLIIAPFYMVVVCLISLLIFFDRIAVSVTNGCFGKHYDFILDPSRKARVHDTSAITVEKEAYLTHGIPKARRSELLQALDIVVKARMVFQQCRPRFPEGHMHFVVVPLSRLVKELKNEEIKRDLCMSPREIENVLQRLNMNSLPSPHSVRRVTFFESLRESQREQERASLSIPSTIPEEGGSAMDTSGISSDSLSRLKESEKPVPECDGASGSLSDQAAKVREFVCHMNPMNLLTKKKAEETEISFSHFVQALQSVAAEKCLHVSRRRSALSVSKFETEDFEVCTEYLH